MGNVVSLGILDCSFGCCARRNILVLEARSEKATKQKVADVVAESENVRDFLHKPPSVGLELFI